LAMAGEGDIAHEDDVVIAADLPEDAVEDAVGLFAIAGVEFLVGADDAAGRLQQALATGVVAGPGDEGADRRRGLGAARPRRRGRRRRRGLGRDTDIHGGFPLIYTAMRWPGGAKVPGSALAGAAAALTGRPFVTI